MARRIVNVCKQIFQIHEKIKLNLLLCISSHLKRAKRLNCKKRFSVINFIATFFSLGSIVSIVKVIDRFVLPSRILLIRR